MTIETKQYGTLLVVSDIDPASIFASTALQVGDVVVGINGISLFQQPQDEQDDEGNRYFNSVHTRTSRASSSSSSNRNNNNNSTPVYCKPDVDIAYKLLDKGADGSLRDHRGRSPGRSNYDLKVTLEYRKPYDMDITMLPPASSSSSSSSPTRGPSTAEGIGSRAVLLASTSSYSTGGMTRTTHHGTAADETTATTFQTDDYTSDPYKEPDPYDCLEEHCSSYAAEAMVSAATGGGDTPPRRKPTTTATTTSTITGSVEESYDITNSSKQDEPKNKKKTVSSSWGEILSGRSFFMNRGSSTRKEITPTRDEVVSGTIIQSSIPNSPFIAVIHKPVKTVTTRTIITITIVTPNEINNTQYLYRICYTFCCY